MMNRRRLIWTILAVGGVGLLIPRVLRPGRFFNEPDLSTLDAHRPLLDALVDTIIPRTDTPGALECGVGGFVVDMVRQCADRQTRFNFMEGLSDLEDRATSSFGRSFTQCSTDERIAMLSTVEEQHLGLPVTVRKIRQKLLGESFISILKYYTVLGFCTSEPGATKALAYDPVPVKFVGIIPLTAGQRSWASQ